MLYVVLILGFTIDFKRTFVVTPDGQDHFMLALQTPPVRTIDDQVTIEFKVQTDLFYNDKRCVKFNPIVLNRKNWQNPQQVNMSFVDYGCCTYEITANGGGYDWQYFRTIFDVLACDGEAGYGCQDKLPCEGEIDKD